VPQFKRIGWHGTLSLLNTLPDDAAVFTEDHHRVPVDPTPVNGDRPKCCLDGANWRRRPLTPNFIVLLVQAHAGPLDVESIGTGVVSGAIDATSAAFHPNLQNKFLRSHDCTNTPWQRTSQQISALEHLQNQQAIATETLDDSLLDPACSHAWFRLRLRHSDPDNGDANGGNANDSGASVTVATVASATDAGEGWEEL
jgi:hypothetical protein